MTARRPTEKSIAIRERVVHARAIQQQRFQASKAIHANALMPSAMVKKVCIISRAGQNLLKAATEKLGLSARAYDRILKVSRTIADLAGTEAIREEHLAEAIQYRSLDREEWGG
jgi:magnesium chelatase family protein